MTNELILLPMPQRLHRLEGSHRLKPERFIWLKGDTSDALLGAGRILQEALASVGPRWELTAAPGDDVSRLGAIVHVDPAQVPWTEGYRLTIGADHVHIVAHDAAGAFYAASELWGKGVHETVKLMREKHGEDVAVMAVGPAGENLVRFACWVNADDRASGRGGTGAVAGSKNLKCIVIKGDRENMPEPADPEALEKTNKAALEHIKDPAMTTAPKVGGLSIHGTEVLMNMVNEVGGLPARNAQRSDFPQADDISGETIRDTILVKTPTCHACAVACKREVEITEGK